MDPGSPVLRGEWVRAPPYSAEGQGQACQEECEGEHYSVPLSGCGCLVIHYTPATCLSLCFLQIFIIYFYFKIFGPCCEACGILVRGPGIEPTPLVLKA